MTNLYLNHRAKYLPKFLIKTPRDIDSVTYFDDFFLFFLSSFSSYCQRSVDVLVQFLYNYFLESHVVKGFCAS